MTEPNSAMASGSDDGTPGRPGGDEPLSPEEQALLADLTSPAPHVVDAAVEDTVAASYAVADDTPLPSAPPAGGDGEDPDTPQFREP